MTDACQNCHSEDGFKVAFVDGGTARMCRACGWYPRADDQAEVLDNHVLRVPAPVKPARQAPPSPAPAAAPATFNVLAAAKARLREVKRLLRELGKLQKERTELERIIAAAEGKREKRAHVVPLRA